MSFWKDEQKGIDCEITSQDGVLSATCKRTIKNKDGSLAHDGQEVNLTANPANDCAISYSGHLAAMDKDGFNAFDPLAKRLKHGCMRHSQKGLSSQPQKAGN